MTLYGFELQNLYNTIHKAGTPENFFGTKATEKSVKDTFRFTLKTIPVPGASVNNAMDDYYANEITRLIIMLKDQAIERLQCGLYGASTFSGSIIDTLTIGPDIYNITRQLRETDFYSLKFAEIQRGDHVEQVVIKTFKSDASSLAENEIKLLKELKHLSIPNFITSFNEKGEQGLITRYIEKSYTLTEVSNKYSDGIRQEHAAWILDRLLNVIGYLHYNNWVHGCLDPDNIIVVPYCHNVIPIDFLLSVKNYHTEDKHYIGMNSYSAPEVNDKTIVHPSSDIYSIGKIIWGLLCGKNMNPKYLPSREFRDLLTELTEIDINNRSDDAWETWGRLSDLREDVFGARNQFLEFKM